MDETAIVRLRKASSACRSISTLSSYPEIPTRRSSLSASVSNGSTGPATSTRTPSLSDSLYQIEIIKIRERNEDAFRETQMANVGSMENQFVDEVCYSCLLVCLAADWNIRFQDRSPIRDISETYRIDQVHGLQFVGAPALGTQESQLRHQAPQALLLEQDLQHQVRDNHHPEGSVKAVPRF